MYVMLMRSEDIQYKRKMYNGNDVDHDDVDHGDDLDPCYDDATASADDNVAIPGDLFLDGLRVGLCEQVEEAAGVVVGVRVGVAQLVRDAVEEEVATLGVHVHSQVLEG